MATKVTNAAYPEVDASPNFPELEVQTLASWKRDGAFAQSIEHREGG
jgi:hypothetical protein